MGKVIMSGIVPKLVAPGLPPIGTALNDMTWEEIRAISDKGLAPNYFSVGDTKTIIINGTVGSTTFSSLSIDVFIIGIDHNSSVEGTNKIHFQIGRINGYDVCLVDGQYGKHPGYSGFFSMNITETCSGGWGSSYMRKTILGSNSAPTSPTSNTLLAALPSDLRAVMKPVSKYTDNTGSSSATASHVTETTDYLWLLSEYEMWGANTNYKANIAERDKQAQYDYYLAGNSKNKHKHNDTSSATSGYGDSWLRSPAVRNGGTTGFCRTSTGSDIPDAMSAHYVYGVPPAFAV